jgi:hypothetical protein
MRAKFKTCRAIKLGCIFILPASDLLFSLGVPLAKKVHNFSGARCFKSLQIGAPLPGNLHRYLLHRFLSFLPSDRAVFLSWPCSVAPDLSTLGLKAGRRGERRRPATGVGSPDWSTAAQWSAPDLRFTLALLVLWLGYCIPCLGLSWVVWIERLASWFGFRRTSISLLRLGCELVVVFW